MRISGRETCFGLEAAYLVLGYVGNTGKKARSVIEPPFQVYHELWFKNSVQRNGNIVHPVLSGPSKILTTMLLLLALYSKASLNLLYPIMPNRSLGLVGPFSAHSTVVIPLYLR